MKYFQTSILVIIEQLNVWMCSTTSLPLGKKKRSAQINLNKVSGVKNVTGSAYSIFQPISLNFTSETFITLWQIFHSSGNTRVVQEKGAAARWFEDWLFCFFSGHCVSICMFDGDCFEIQNRNAENTEKNCLGCRTFEIKLQKTYKGLL